MELCSLVNLSKGKEYIDVHLTFLSNFTRFENFAKYRGK